MIDKITLKNFKSFIDQEIELAPLTLLTGVNSSGKSSIIQALRIFQLAFNRSIEFSRETGEPIAADLPNLGDHGNYNLLRSDHGSAKEFSGIYLGLHSRRENEISLSINGDQEYTIDEHEENSVNIKNKKILITRELKIPLKNLIYISAGRVGARVYHSTVHDTNWGQMKNDIGENGEYVFEFIAKHYSELIEPPLVKSPVSLRNAINEWLSEITPGTSIDAQMIHSSDTAILTVNGFRPTNVGFGFSYTLPIIAVLLYGKLFSGRKRTVFSPIQIICIENPEAHLHPRAQTKMGELIAKAASEGVQVIVETHSEHVIDGIRMAVKNNIIPSAKVGFNFFDLEKGTTQVETLKIDSDGKLDKWPKGFCDQFLNNGRELL